MISGIVVFINLIFLVAYTIRIEGKWSASNVVEWSLSGHVPATLADKVERFTKLHQVLPVSFVFLGSKS